VVSGGFKAFTTRLPCSLFPVPCSPLLSMLNFLHLGAALATIFSPQVSSNLLTTQENFTEQWRQARESKVLLNDSILNSPIALINTQPSISAADYSTNTPEAEKTFSSETMLGIAAVGGVAVGVILSAKKVNTHIKSSSSISTKGQGNTKRFEGASYKHQKKLLKLLHNDRETASRLLSHAKQKNPNRSMNWCVEKVIYDLERDRG
jgi:hypothetical protein